MTIEQGKIYWLEHRAHGTQRGKAVLVSSNGLSVGFVLDNEVALRHPGGGMAISRVLPLLFEKGHFRDLVTEEPWRIYDGEPENKLPTE